MLRKSLEALQLIAFVFIFVQVSLISTADVLFAAGEHDGIWVGPETIVIPGYETIVETTGTVVYQQDQNNLYFYDSLFGAVRLIKSGNQWSLPSPIWTTFDGYQAYLSQFDLIFTSNSHFAASLTVEVIGVTATGSLSHTKQSCPNLTNGSTISNISGAVDSVHCYQIDLPAGATDLNAQTWGGLGDCDLYLIYHRPDFDLYTSEDFGNKEQITITAPPTGRWYIILIGYEAYSGLNLEVSYTGIPAPAADFDVDSLSGRIPFTVNFTDRSSGTIDSWSWDFGDGSISDEQNPVHTYVVPGNYTVSLTVTGPGGSDIETKSELIEVRYSGMPWNQLFLFDD